MFGFLKRLFGRGTPPPGEIDPDEIAYEQWKADFSRPDDPDKPPRLRFSITSENAFRAYLEDGALRLGLKKTSCLAWIDDPVFRYDDLYLKSRISLESRGGYAAAGLIFRMVDDRTYYLALVSDKGYFRLDLVRNGVPLALAGWTEAPGIRAGGPVDFELEVLASGSRILLLINGQWVGSWNDPSISAGRIAFAAASYEGETPETRRPLFALGSLLSLELDSRPGEAARRREILEAAAPPDNRIRLAETMTALGQINPALVQIRKAWEGRENAAAALTRELATAEDAVVLAAIQTENPEAPFRHEKELLLASKLAMALEQWDEAAEYIEEGLERNRELLPEFRNMKAALLYARGQYGELIRWAGEIPAGSAAVPGEAVPPDEAAGPDEAGPGPFFADPAAFYNLLGHASFNTGDYRKAAASYDRSFALNERGGIAAKNAAAAYELLDRKDEALERYLKAGRAFLADNLYAELGLLIPKFRLLGPGNWEARALAGKWAFGIEDWKSAGEELEKAEELRKAGPAGPAGPAGSAGPEGAGRSGGASSAKKQFAPDPAIYFLRGLLLVREGRRREALPLLERAAKLAPDYPLFRFRLAENRFLIKPDGDDPAFVADLEAALKAGREDSPETYGWIRNFAAHLALSRGEVDKAQAYLEEAASILGEVPAVRVNRAVSLYLKEPEESPGEGLARALAVLESRPDEDPEGLMANCAGNLLVRSRRFEEADPWYRRALAAAPANIQYRYNRASCLIELARYGEADDVLTAGLGGRDFSPESSPDMLELIAFVAVKKGEYKRAEAASRAALAIDPGHVPSLLQLGWSAAFAGRWDDAAAALARLDELELGEDAARGRNDLEARMEEALYKTAACASCGREWKVARNPPAQAKLRLYAVPPDDMPAGVCPGCGKTYCVGCRRDALDESGRFVCPDCGKTLKLTDDGLRALLNDWAEHNIGSKKRKKKTPPKPPPETATPPEQTEPAAETEPPPETAAEPPETSPAEPPPSEAPPSETPRAGE